MALTNQPYLPLYVDDWMNNNKLKICSLSAKGLMIQIMCVMHKSDDYGSVLLKAKFKQKNDLIKDFALQVSKLCNSSYEEVYPSLQELIEEGVLKIENESLNCSRMMKDFAVSKSRAENGKKGGSETVKQYGKSGIIYLMSDTENNHKIGVTTNLKSRVYRIRSDYKLSKLFDCVDSFEVDDMGKSEDLAKEFFNDIISGEWLKSDFETIKEKFVLLKAKLKQNTVNEIVIENVNEIENKNVAETVDEKPKRKKTEIEKSEIVFPFYTEKFRVHWQLWKVYKSKEFKFNFKSIQSEQANLNELANLSQGNETTAIAIINQSMAKGWKGFFELKNNNLNGNWNNNIKQSDSELKSSVNDAVDKMFG